jgi:hypothetical protein
MAQHLALNVPTQPSESAVALSVVEPSVASKSVALPTAKATEQKPLLSRWLEVSEMSESQRFRRSYDQNSATIFNNGQQRTALAGRVKLDREGRYFIGFRAESGRFFNWGFADYAGHDFTHYAGLSLGSFTPKEFTDFFAAYVADTADHTGLNFHGNGWNFYMRDLYGSATPIKQATVEFGSIPIERGYSSEITSFDDDGFIAGERIRLNDPKHLGLDEVSFTSAYFGDMTTPSVFARGDRLAQSNYRQIAGKKMIHQRVGISGEYNWLTKSSTVREAATVKVSELKVIDDLHAEFYQRLNAMNLQGMDIQAAKGFALSASKKVGPVSGDFGYASVDPNYGVYTDSRFLTVVGFSLNGDTYGTGKRVYSHLSYKLTPVITVFGFYTHITSGDDYNYNKQGLNAGLKFDLKAIVNSGRKIF